MDLLSLGIAALVGFALIDTMIRARMARLGYKWVFLLGAFFDYREYTKVRAEHGWSAWPVRLMWLPLVLRDLAHDSGLLRQYGFHPKPLSASQAMRRRRGPAFSASWCFNLGVYSRYLRRAVGRFPCSILFPGIRFFLRAMPEMHSVQ